MSFKTIDVVSGCMRLQKIESICKRLRVDIFLTSENGWGSTLAGDAKKNEDVPRLRKTSRLRKTKTKTKTKHRTCRTHI